VCGETTLQTLVVLLILFLYISFLQPRDDSLMKAEESSLEPVFSLRVLVFHFSWPPGGHKGLGWRKTRSQAWLLPQDSGKIWLWAQFISFLGVTWPLGGQAVY
jgi:hypothetical protein